jgi:hypothetical protein
MPANHLENSQYAQEVAPGPCQSRTVAAAFPVIIRLDGPDRVLGARWQSTPKVRSPIELASLGRIHGGSLISQLQWGAGNVHRNKNGEREPVRSRRYHGHHARFMRMVTLSNSTMLRRGLLTATASQKTTKMGYDLEATDLLENCLSNGFEPPALFKSDWCERINHRSSVHDGR